MSRLKGLDFTLGNICRIYAVKFSFAVIPHVPYNLAVSDNRLTIRQTALKRIYLTYEITLSINLTAVHSAVKGPQYYKIIIIDFYKLRCRSTRRRIRSKLSVHGSVTVRGKITQINISDFGVGTLLNTVYGCKITRTCNFKSTYTAARLICTVFPFNFKHINRCTVIVILRNKFTRRDRGLVFYKYNTARIGVTMIQGNNFI